MLLGDPFLKTITTVTSWRRRFYFCQDFIYIYNKLNINYTYCNISVCIHIHMNIDRMYTHVITCMQVIFCVVYKMA